MLKPIDSSTADSKSAFNPLALLKDVDISFTRNDFSIAIIGFGKMGLLHATILNLLRKGSVKYIVDKSRLIRIGGRLLVKNIKFLGDLEALIDVKEKVDAIYITTPTQTHFPVAKRLLEAGFKHIFIEKPPTQNLEQFNELLDLKRGANVMIGFQKRFALPLRHAKLLLDNGVLGELKSVYASLKSGDIIEPNDRFRSLGRGVLLDLGVHVVDLLCWLLNGELQVESAKCKSIFSGVDDHFEAVLARENVKVHFETTWSDPSYRLPETYIKIKGSNGELEVSEDYLKVRIYEPYGNVVGNELSLYRPHYYRGFPPVLVADQEYTIENMHFLTTIEHGIGPITSLEACKHTMITLEELYKRAFHG